MTAVNIEDIGAPGAPVPQQQGIVPQLGAPMPIGPAGGPPVEIPSRVNAPPAAPDFPQSNVPIPIDGAAHAQAGHPASHPEAHAVAIRARAHEAHVAAGGQPMAAPPGPDDLMAPDLGGAPPPQTPEQVTAQGSAQSGAVADEMVTNAQGKAEVDADAKKQLAEEKQRQVDEQNNLQAQQDAAVAHAEKMRDDARAQVQGFQFHDHFEGHTGRRVIAAVGLALGGDPAILERKIQQQFAQQTAELKKRQESAEGAARDTNELRERHRDEWQQLKFRQGAALDAVAAKIDQEAASNAGKIDVTKAKQLAQDYRTKAAESDLKAQHDVASIHLLKAQTAEAYAKASHERQATGSAKADKAAAQDDAALSKAVAAFDKQHGITGEKGLSKRLEDLSTAYSEATAATQNPLTQITIMDKIIRSATGLGVRGQVLQTYRDRLGGLEAKGQGKLQEWANGTEGKQQWANVVSYIQDALARAQKEGAVKNRLFGQTFKGPRALPVAKRRQESVGALETGMFGSMPGYGGEPAAPATPPPAIIRGPRGDVQYLQPDGVTYLPTQPGRK